MYDPLVEHVPVLQSDALHNLQEIRIVYYCDMAPLLLSAAHYVNTALLQMRRHCMIPSIGMICTWNTLLSLTSFNEGINLS